MKLPLLIRNSLGTVLAIGASFTALSQVSTNTPIVSGVITITAQQPFNPDGSLKSIWTMTISDSNGVRIATVTNRPPASLNFHFGR